MTSPDPARLYRGVSLEQRQGDRRSRFIEAGLTVIGSQGFSAATVRTLCAEAGLTERYFYESFENREELLTAVYEHGIGHLMMAVLKAIEQSEQTPDATSRAGLQAFFDTLKADPRIGRVLFIEILGVSPKVDELYRRTTYEFTRLILQVSRPLYPGGRLPVRDEELVATGMVGAIIMIATRWILGGYDKPAEDVLDSAVEIFRAINQQLVARVAAST